MLDVRRLPFRAVDALRMELARNFVALMVARSKVLLTAIVRSTMTKLVEKEQT